MDHSNNGTCHAVELSVLCFMPVEVELSCASSMQTQFPRRCVLWGVDGKLVSPAKDFGMGNSPLFVMSAEQYS